MIPLWIGSSFVMLLTFADLQAQTGIPPRNENSGNPWTIVLEGGYASGISASMRGTDAEFESQIETNYNNSDYPFGDPNASGGMGAIRAEYRFLPGNISVYSALRLGSFTTYDANQDTAFLAIGSFSLGAEYTYNLTNTLDVYGDAGINSSLIGGQLAFQYFIGHVTIDISNPNLRFGYELGLGADWNPWSIILVRAFVDYLNVNVIGKSYTSPGAVPPEPIPYRALNDGANPNDPNDHPRTIDYLMSGLALGIRF